MSINQIPEPTIQRSPSIEYPRGGYYDDLCPDVIMSKTLIFFTFIQSISIISFCFFSSLTLLYIAIWIYLKKQGFQYQYQLWTNDNYIKKFTVIILNFSHQIVYIELQSRFIWSLQDSNKIIMEFILLSFNVCTVQFLFQNLQEQKKYKIGSCTIIALYFNFRFMIVDPSIYISNIKLLVYIIGVIYIIFYHITTKETYNIVLKLMKNPIRPNYCETPQFLTNTDIKIVSEGMIKNLQENQKKEKEEDIFQMNNVQPIENSSVKQKKFFDQQYRKQQHYLTQVVQSDHLPITFSFQIGQVHSHASPKKQIISKKLAYKRHQDEIEEIDNEIDPVEQRKFCFSNKDSFSKMNYTGHTDMGFKRQLISLMDFGCFLLNQDKLMKIQNYDFLNNFSISSNAHTLKDMVGYKNIWQTAKSDLTSIHQTISDLNQQDESSSYIFVEKKVIDTNQFEKTRFFKDNLNLFIISNKKSIEQDQDIQNANEYFNYILLSRKQSIEQEVDSILLLLSNIKIEDIVLDLTIRMVVDVGNKIHEINLIPFKESSKCYILGMVHRVNQN